MHEGFPQPELIVSHAIRKACGIGRVRGVGLNHDLCLHPGLIGTLFRIHPVVDKDELPIGFCFVAQAVFCVGSRRLERNLLAARAIEPITGSKIAVEFKRPHLLLKFRDRFICFPEQVIGRLRR